MNNVDLVNVFTYEEQGGNPCPVVTCADGMSSADMQDVARRFGRESGFVFSPKSGDYDFSFRFFVPNHEMEMCGHATIGALWVLMRQGRLPAETVRIETRSGPVTGFVTLGSDGQPVVEITQPAGKVVPLSRDEEAEVLSVLGIGREALAPLPVHNAVTSRVKTLIPINDRERLNKLVTSASDVEAVCRRIGSTGLYPYSTLDAEARTFEARQFPRSSGYPEDAATGIAATALVFGLLNDRSVAPDDRIIRVLQGRARRVREGPRTQSVRHESNRSTTPMTGQAEANSALEWKLFIRRRASATQGVPPGKDDLKWVANTATLICGRTDALLVDAFLSDAQTAELADWIAATGKRLSTIYITHAHPDHFFGLKLLRDRFPEARAIAAPQVVDAMRMALAPESVENWRRRFPGLVPASLVPAERLEGKEFDLEGNRIVVVDIGHTDTDNTTCVHVPLIGLVIAGDAIYNGTHPYLVESDGQGLLDWLDAIDKIEALKPQAVVVGHGPLDPDNSPRHIQETRSYIQDFMRVDAEAKTARELYDRMLALYPDRINPGSLWGSANAAKAPGRAKAPR